MKKISITIWIILAGIFLYTATLWQRPLFVFEFSDWAALTEPAAKSSLLPLSRHLELFILNKVGASPFFFRIGTALLTLLSALVLFLSGNKSTLSNASKGGAMIFLLTPAIFLGEHRLHPFSNRDHCLRQLFLPFSEQVKAKTGNQPSPGEWRRRQL